MDSNNIILFSILGLIVWAIIIYQIILNASKSKEIKNKTAEIEKQLKIQNPLIAKLLQKEGLDIDVINSILVTGRDPVKV